MNNLRFYIREQHEIVSQNDTIFAARAVRSFTFVLVVPVFALLAMLDKCEAATAIWTGASNALWSDSSNWSPTTNAPQSGDDVEFGTSARTTTNVDASFSLATITFDAGAPSYTNNIQTNKNLTVTGTGIVNNSGLQQNFFIAPSSFLLTTLTFQNSATAGTSNVAITSQGTTSFSDSGGIARFQGNSTAGSATITTNAGGSGGFGSVGKAEFYDSATAGAATMTINGGSSSFSGSVAEFNNTSTAGSANISVNGGATAGNNANGQLYIRDNSTTASATINNNGSNANNANGGITSYVDSATANQATIHNNGGVSPNARSGVTQFALTSTAASATIDNRSGTVGGAYGGGVTFGNSTTAGTANITNRGSAFDRNLHSQLGFNPNGGSTTFGASASADHATITNEGGSAIGARGGITDFSGGIGGSATIINGGGTVSGASGGETLFEDSASAGAATIITHGGVAGATGGTVIFTGTSDGGSARAITDAGGTVQILTSSPGMQIGSIEGSGTYLLFSRTLRVGNNSLSTTVSGNIQGDSGGALVKEGTGTLTLSGANTYTGGTTINSGTLIVGNTTGSATGDGPVQVNSSGKLAGTGSIGGSLTVGSGGHVAPGASAGILTVSQPTIFGSGSIFDIELGGTIAGNGTGMYDRLAVSNTATINGGTLNVNLIDGFTPHVGDLFQILTSSALAINNQFTSNLPQPPTGAAWEVRYGIAGSQAIELALVSTGIAGDYNNDGRVNSEDYVIWRKTNINSNQGYSDWRSNYGTGGTGSGSGLEAGSSVPEPATIVMLYVGTIALCPRRAKYRTLDPA